VRQLLEDIYTAMKTGDADALAGLVSQQPDVVVGTDPAEWWTGRDQIVSVWGKQLEELGSVELVRSDPATNASGDVGWAADRPTFRLGEMEIPVRVTLVGRHEDGVWRLVQWHASLGQANEDALGRELTTQ
jgi:hypothetical protein